MKLIIRCSACPPDSTEHGWWRLLLEAISRGCALGNYFGWYQVYLPQIYLVVEVHTEQPLLRRMCVLCQEHYTNRLCNLWLLVLITVASWYDLIILVRRLILEQVVYTIVLFMLLRLQRFGKHAHILERAANDLGLVEPLIAGGILF